MTNSEVLGTGVKLASLGMSAASAKPEMPDFSPIPPPLLPEVKEQTRDFERSPEAMLAASQRRKESEAKYKAARMAEEEANIMALSSYGDSTAKTNKGRYMTPPPVADRLRGVESKVGGYL
jgi:hypothetical protein